MKHTTGPPRVTVSDGSAVKGSQGCETGGSKDDRGELTDIHAAHVLGKATTSAAVEHVLSQPDPWGALNDRLAWQEELDRDREAGS